MNPPQLTADTEALLQGYLEGTLTPEDSTRLLAALKSQPELVGVLLDGLRMDALIREVVTQTEAATSRAMTPLRPQSTSEERSRRREEADQDSFSRLKSASLPRRLRHQWNRPVILALAACFVFMIGLAAWFFGPAMGRPVLAEVKGVGVSIERGTEFIPAAKGMVLQLDDVLHLGTNASATITYGAEKTRLELSAGTELKLASLARGKRFVLHEGRIEAAVARQRPWKPMILTTAQAEARVLGTKFTVTAETNATRLEVTEGNVKLTRTSDDAAVKVPAGRYAVAAVATELAALPLTGSVLREYWTNLPGDYYITFLTSHPDYPDHPSGREYLDKFEAPSHWGTNYGARIHGYLHPPKTGEYTFWIAAGDGGELFLSPDDNYLNRQQIGNAAGCAPYEWTRLRKQQSSVITLVAGRKYYIEALHKQGKKDDHLAVAWQGPGREREVIPGKFLSPFKSQAKEKKR